MKNVLIIFLAVVVAGCCWLAFSYGQKSAAAQGVLDEERYQRISAEEKFENEKTNAASLEAELGRVSKKISGLEKLLEEAKAANDELKARLKDSEEKRKTLDETLQKIPEAPMPVQ